MSQSSALFFFALFANNHLYFSPEEFCNAICLRRRNFLLYAKIFLLISFIHVIIETRPNAQKKDRERERREREKERKLGLENNYKFSLSTYK